MQWHPLLAELLRPVVEAYYEVQTNVPVGDLPREADIVLLRRKSTGRTPFHSVWAGLRTWNVLEFKSPSVAPQLRDLDLLIEIGLGIDRRLNDERAKQRMPLLPRNETAFWYLVNRLSDRFVDKCHTTLGAVRPCGAGVWRADLLERPLFLVGNADLPVDHESLPLHVVSHGSLEAEREVARFVAAQPDLRRLYGSWLFALHGQAWKEMRTMAQVAEDEVPIDFNKIADYIGLDRLIEQVGADRLIEKMIEQGGVERLIEQVGRKRVIEKGGTARLAKTLGAKRMIEEMGMDQFLASLTPAQRRELKRKLGRSRT